MRLHPEVTEDEAYQWLKREVAQDGQAGAADEALESTLRSFAEAMLNLVHNAIDAARPGSNVIVTVRPAGKSDVVWEIAGDGLDPTPGLADPTTPSLPALNVALAQLAVEAHGGLLNFESEMGHGTSASVWIPDAREP